MRYSLFCLKVDQQTLWNVLTPGTSTEPKYVEIIECCIYVTKICVNIRMLTVCIVSCMAFVLYNTRGAMAFWKAALLTGKFIKPLHAS